MSENQQHEIPNIIIEIDGNIYSINLEEKAAKVIGSKSLKRDIFIPRSIYYESTEFIVTRISTNAFENSTSTSIHFPIDSELQTIEKEAFDYSLIDTLTIPASLINLEDGWCSGMHMLTKINISSENPRYKLYDNKFIIGKSSEESENFDSLVFCVRNAQTATIPNFIKHIGPFAFHSCNQITTVEFPIDSELLTIEKYAFSPSRIQCFSVPVHLTKIGESAFYNCVNLQSVEIPTNSELQIIGERAFMYSSIDSFKIPPHLTKICENAFLNCNLLTTIEIPTNSELRTIEKDAFYCSPIKSFSIPESLIDLKEGWCTDMEKLKSISVSPDNPRYKLYDNKFVLEKSNEKSENFDSLVFCVRNVKSVTIPNFIKHIGPFAFNCCKKLRVVEFEPNSELLTIEREAFSRSFIENFKVPPHLKKICDSAFESCINLEKIEIPTNSELHTIEIRAFRYTFIESLAFPSSLVDLQKGWNIDMRNLTKISVSPNNPRYLCLDEKFIIGKSSIDNNEYDVFVFCTNNVRHVKIPSFIKHIGACSFRSNQSLQSVELSTDSKLQTIEEAAFSFSKIERFSISPHLTKICESAFAYCEYLQVFEIPSNSNLQIIEQEAFQRSSITSFIFPAHLTQIDKNAFLYCRELQIIEIDENSELEIIDKSIFPNYNNLIMIPAKLRDFIKL